MSGKKIKMAIVISLISTYIAVSFSISVLFILFLLGATFLPPVIVFVYILKEGAPLISRELNSYFSSGKETFVISFSNEHIILEPEYR